MATYRYLKPAIMAVVGFGILSASVGQQSADKVDIKLSFEPGRYEFTQEVSVYDERALEKTRIGQRIDTVQIGYLRTLGVQPDGQVGFTAQLGKVAHVVSTGPMGVPEWDIVLKYDSTDPDKQDPAIAEAFKSLLDKQIDLTVPIQRPKQGDSDNVPPLIDIFNHRLDGRELADAVVRSFRNNINEAVVWQSAGLLPAGPVGIGQKWEGVWEVRMPGQEALKIPVECKLVSVGGKDAWRRATVEFAGRVEKSPEALFITASGPAKTASAPAGGAAATQQALRIDIRKISVEVKGSSKFNLFGGIINCLETQQMTSIDMSIAGPEGVNIPAQATSKASVKITVTPQDKSVSNPLDDPSSGRPATTQPASPSRS